MCAWFVVQPIVVNYSYITEEGFVVVKKKNMHVHDLLNNL